MREETPQPICSYCRDIRDEDGAWIHFETYLRNHTRAEFTHGVCPHCFEEQMAKIQAMTDIIPLAQPASP